MINVGGLKLFQSLGKYVEQHLFSVYKEIQPPVSLAITTGSRAKQQS